MSKETRIEYHAGCRWCGQVQPVLQSMVLHHHLVKGTLINCLGSGGSLAWWLIDVRESVPFRTIIAGSRDIEDFALVEDAMEKSKLNVRWVLSGRARGVDQLGEKWAKSKKIPVVYFPADWKNDGQGAGMIRNEKMKQHADALVAVWDGKSKGTMDMIKRAAASGLHTFVSKVVSR